MGGDSISPIKERSFHEMCLNDGLSGVHPSH